MENADPIGLHASARTFEAAMYKRAPEKRLTTSKSKTPEREREREERKGKKRRLDSLSSRGDVRSTWLKLESREPVGLYIPIMNSGNYLASNSQHQWRRRRKVRRRTRE